MKTKEEKIAIIKELRNKGMSYKEIGGVLSISRQRIHQLYKNYKPTDTELVKEIKKRDHYECQLKDKGCDSVLEVHHIDGIKVNNTPTNLITVCKSCHMKLEKVLRNAKRGKITADETKKIKQAISLRKKGKSLKEISEILGEKKGWVFAKCKGVDWWSGY